MDLQIVFMLFFASASILAYYFSKKHLVKEVHLPDEIKGRPADFRDILTLPVRLAERLIEKGNIPFENLRRKLVSSGKLMNAGQFFAFKLLLMGLLPFATFVLLQPKDPTMLLAPLLIGFVYPDIWLNNKVRNRQAAILRELPHIIDLLNICVGAGLDFMVAVTWVTEGFRKSALIEEFNVMLKEIQMGISRRQALKNLSIRINSMEMSSFVRTLLQADRMGTPIAEALKIQAEEVRFRRFQRGEEMGLKAPIKLLFPLLFFILPVVMIIVAGPILIQFTRGGFLKF
ncbi:MAG: type II secretion system F family protein [Candidatus Omnitrophica bacterium]|nr:type II secretion system F family protein [Candidatus Omnitrophota bacterium]